MKPNHVFLAALVLWCPVPMADAADGHVRHPFFAKQAANAPEEAVLAVEIPA